MRARGGDYRPYNSRQWRAFRKAILAIEPLCRACYSLGRVTEATEVDHIVPLSAGGLQYERGNCQSLCKPCHSAKTLRESVRSRR